MAAKVTERTWMSQKHASDPILDKRSASVQSKVTQNGWCLIFMDVDMTYTSVRMSMTLSMILDIIVCLVENRMRVRTIA